MTQHVGLTPNEDEYVLMGMSAYGDSTHVEKLKLNLIRDSKNLDFNHNLHIGVSDLLHSNVDQFDIAAQAQMICEDLINQVMHKAKEFNWSQNLVYMGGVALNCLANRNLSKYFENIWIMPNPGDAGSSLGAAALYYGKKINWVNSFLGHNIDGNYPVDDAVSVLLREQIVGIASGRAEFGPRALGNRSLLADPRGTNIKDRVNEIKRRQEFRPFAPVILEELASSYFDMPRGWHHSRYMQSVADCRNPELFPAIVHADGTSRVQTVPKDGSGIRQLLEKWYAMTGCPMLLNTSLNIRSKPMVNDRADAERFELLYNIKVLS
jgi:carbamoyltransferase